MQWVSDLDCLFRQVFYFCLGLWPEPAPGLRQVTPTVILPALEKQYNPTILLTQTIETHRHISEAAPSVASEAASSVTECNSF